MVRRNCSEVEVNPTGGLEQVGILAEDDRGKSENDEMDTAYHAIPPLQEIFDGARLFGLSDTEVWQAFDESLDEAGPSATVGDYVEELTAELARRILRKQRCSTSEDRRVPSRKRL